jgi:quercetin dioxygenase-like cupin family protein
MYQEIHKIPPREIVPGYRARFIHTEHMTLAFWDVDAGATMPLHRHHHEQTSQVLDGKFELTVGDERKMYEPGTVVVIPPNTLHGGVAVTACRLLDIFSPVREDYK